MANKSTWLPSEKDIEDYNLLKEMLDSQRKEFDLLSRKKADGQLNPMKIKMVNRALDPLRELCKHEQSHSFLDEINEDDMPTYSDIVLVISQYETALSKFYSKYYTVDKFQKDEFGRSTYRWMTKECPPDFHSQ